MPHFFENPLAVLWPEAAIGSYPENPSVFPVNYGLIVIDFDSKTITHAQGFMDPTAISESDIVGIPAHSGSTQGQWQIEMARHGLLSAALFCEDPMGEALTGAGKGDTFHVFEPIVLSENNGANIAKDYQDAQERNRDKAKKNQWKEIQAWKFVRMALPEGWKVKEYDPESIAGCAEFFRALQKDGWNESLDTSQWVAFAAKNKVGAEDLFLANLAKYKEEILDERLEKTPVASTKRHRL